MLREAKEDLTGSNKSLQGRYDEAMLSRSNATNAEIEQSSERIQELEGYVKELEEENESIKS